MDGARRDSGIMPQARLFRRPRRRLLPDPAGQGARPRRDLPSGPEEPVCGVGRGQGPSRPAAPGRGAPGPSRLGQGLGSPRRRPLARGPQSRPGLFPRRGPEGRHARYGRLSRRRARAQVLQPLPPPAVRGPSRGARPLPAGPGADRSVLARGQPQDGQRGPHGRLRAAHLRLCPGRPSPQRRDGRQDHGGGRRRRSRSLPRHARSPRRGLSLPGIPVRPSLAGRLAPGPDRRPQRGLRLDRRPQVRLSQDRPRPRGPGRHRAGRPRRARPGRPRPRPGSDGGQDLRAGPDERPDGPVPRVRARAGRQRRGRPGLGRGED